jgi:hypothetical protein
MLAGTIHTCKHDFVARRCPFPPLRRLKVLRYLVLGVYRFCDRTFDLVLLKIRAENFANGSANRERWFFPSLIVRVVHHCP